MTIWNTVQPLLARRLQRCPSLNKLGSMCFSLNRMGPTFNRHDPTKSQRVWARIDIKPMSPVSWYGSVSRLLHALCRGFVVQFSASGMLARNPPVNLPSENTPCINNHYLERHAWRVGHYQVYEGIFLTDHCEALRGH